MPQRRRYWLMKSEPRVFSIRTLHNLQSRPPLGMACGTIRRATSCVRWPPATKCFFTIIMPSRRLWWGLRRSCERPIPDETQFDKTSHHYDPASVPSAPRWDMVDIRYRQTFKTSLPLDRLRQEPKLKGMVLLQKGSRLSVQPVTEAEWALVLKLAGTKSG